MATTSSEHSSAIHLKQAYNSINSAPLAEIEFEHVQIWLKKHKTNDCIIPISLCLLCNVELLLKLHYGDEWVWFGVRMKLDSSVENPKNKNECSPMFSKIPDRIKAAQVDGCILWLIGRKKWKEQHFSMSKNSSIISLKKKSPSVLTKTTQKVIVLFFLWGLAPEFIMKWGESVQTHSVMSLWSPKNASCR